MSNIVRLFSLLQALMLIGCAGLARDRSMTASECAAAKVCVVKGTMTISSDGHAFIGFLKLPGNKCVNVSLPEHQSRSLLDRGEVEMQISGRVFPFPRGEDVEGWKVNGRSVGFGNCGDFYVFVE